MLFENIKIEIKGTSRSEKIEMKVSGLSGMDISLESAQKMLDRRKSSSNPWSTPRKEQDQLVVDAGLNGNKVEGDLVFHINNENIIHESSKFPRPSHADYVGIITGKETEGGGKFSGRMTAPICALGGIAKKALEEKGIFVNAYISKIGSVELGKYQNSKYELTGINEKLRKVLEQSDFPVIDDKNKERAVNEIIKAKDSGDSVGGEVQCIITGVKAGCFGDSLFDGLEGLLSYSIYGIPAVKGVTFGHGDKTSIFGSDYNDSLYFDDGNVKTKTNNDGGINGGISNGMPITLTAFVKPTPSITKEQDSVDLKSNKNIKMIYNGRNDSCIVPRIVPCVESVVCIALLDLLLKKDNQKEETVYSIRSKIDVIDLEMKKLFLKRLDLVKNIGILKKDQGYQIEDLNREKQVLDTITDGLSDEEKNAMISLYKEIFNISKKIEK